MVISSIQTRINKKMKNKNINKIKDINIINMNYKLSDIGKSCKNKTGKNFENENGKHNKSKLFSSIKTNHIKKINNNIALNIFLYWIIFSYCIRCEYKIVIKTKKSYNVDQLYKIINTENMLKPKRIKLNANTISSSSYDYIDNYLRIKFSERNQVNRIDLIWDEIRLDDTSAFGRVFFN